MTTLSYLNEPGVLWNLRCRYLLDAIYTYTGSILIAVNPFARLPHLYGPHMMEQYRGRELGELSPHVYAIADAAYRQMRKEGRSQSILVRPAVAAFSSHTQRPGSRRRHCESSLASVVVTACSGVLLCCSSLWCLGNVHSLSPNRSLALARRANHAV